MLSGYQECYEIRLSSNQRIGCYSSVLLLLWRRTFPRKCNLSWFHCHPTILPHSCSELLASRRSCLCCCSVLYDGLYHGCTHYHDAHNSSFSIDDCFGTLLCLLWTLFLPFLCVLSCLFVRTRLFLVLLFLFLYLLDLCNVAALRRSLRLFHSSLSYWTSVRDYY